MAGWDTLADKQVFDIGCGVKIAQAIVEFDLPIRKYHGLDINPEIIGFLRDALEEDERFDFTFSNFHNELYNPNGERMGAESHMPVEVDHFDAAWAFSVFTHLNPNDTRHMLRMARDCLVEGGLFYFSAFINPGAAEPFVDAIPDQPLKWAYFSEEFFIEMILESGLEVVRYREPEEHIQHQFLCQRVGTPSGTVPELETTDFFRDRIEVAIESNPAFREALEAQSKTRD